MEVIAMKSGYDRRKSAPVLHYRPMTIAEAKALRCGQTVTFQSVTGEARNVKVNGQPKTWKRDPNRVEVPVKYGLYEYATLRNRADGTMERLVVEVTN